MKQTHTTNTFLFISHTTNVLLFKFHCNIFIGVRIIKETPGSLASGTPFIKGSCSTSHSLLIHHCISQPISYWLQQTRLLPTDELTTPLNITPLPLQITALNWKYLVIRESYEPNQFMLILKNPKNNDDVYQEGHLLH
jgi:hypothetical protein